MSGYIGVQPVPQATQRREYFTATNGQATFNTNGYTPNYIDVYMNGVKLSPADFTASNGSDVVLASGATTGDPVQVVSFTPFNVANQTFIGDVNLSSGAYKIGGNTVINSSRAGSLTSLDVTGNATFADNGKAVFGAGSDLQIYHNTTGFTGNIIESATNNLYIRSNSLYFQKADGTENNMFAISDGAVSLAYDNAAKLATTSTGIDVTGTANVDVLTQTNGAGTLTLKDLGGSSSEIEASGTLHIDFQGSNFEINTNDTARFNISSGGDISFYEDTGTTAKLTWSASTESLRFDSATLQAINGTDPFLSGNAYYDGSNWKYATSTDATNYYQLGREHIWRSAASGTAGNNITWSNQMVIDSSGNVKINNGNLQIERSGSSPLLQFTDTGVNSRWMGLVDGTSNFTIYGTDGTTQELTLDASGNLLVGTTDKNIRDSSSAEGMVYRKGLTLDINTSAAPVIIMNRVGNSDGDIALFRKDGVTMGRIGSSTNIAGNFFIAGSSGLQFRSDDILPTNSSGVYSNGAVDLGDGGAKFRNLYLSGGVVFGDAGGSGTSTSNSFDSYETGTWTPNINAGYTSATYNIQHGTYTKIGDTVRAYFRVDLSGGTAVGTAVKIGGLPFTVKAAGNEYPTGFGYINDSASLSDNFFGIALQATTNVGIYTRSSTNVTGVHGTTLGNSLGILYTVIYRTNA